MKKKILFILGTRPEAVKIAPLFLALREHQSFEPLIALTGQHPTMADEILNFFGITPDFKMALHRETYSLTEFTAECLCATGDVIENISPSLIFVHGDTSSSFCGALSGYYHKIKVAHLEAGLRTHNKYSPFPEEILRKMTGTIADYNFAPTNSARESLLRENIPPDSIHVVGNTVIDALLWTVRRLQDNPVLLTSVINDLAMLGLPPLGDNMVLITGHRRENFGEKFEKICQSIKTLSRLYPHYHFVYPVHLNPNVQAPVNAILGTLSNVHLIAPVNYPHFVYLMQKSHFILSDSGGIQEEAPSLGKPVLVMRDTTERPEAIEANCARLVGVDGIIQGASALIDDPGEYHAMAHVENPYGDGHAADRIVDILQDVL